MKKIFTFPFSRESLHISSPTTLQPSLVHFSLDKALSGLQLFLLCGRAHGFLTDTFECRPRCLLSEKVRAYYARTWPGLPSDGMKNGAKFVGSFRATKRWLRVAGTRRDAFTVNHLGREWLSVDTWVDIESCVCIILNDSIIHRYVKHRNETASFLNTAEQLEWLVSNCSWKLAHVSWGSKGVVSVQIYS